DLSLFLDQELLQRLHAARPMDSLDNANLQDFWTVLEGVSHFLFLVWNAGYERDVSPVEMELQAEVDKFIATAMLSGENSDNGFAGRLHDCLFHDHKYHARLSVEEQQRYRDANRYAAKYCWNLVSKYFQNRDPGLLAELRRFYRLPRRAKLSYINQLRNP
ncbi:MAG: hypothetical protein MJA83_05405, partial [Gammaproteobacteria bacterium]|nr:hypothetical protein [Gammaproteobacteria bacterium]